VTPDYAALREQLCQQFCSAVFLKEREGGALLSLPVHDRDGDAFTVFIQPIAAGWRISDRGNTFMRLSYENDVERLLKGNRGRLLESFLTEAGATESDGEITVEGSADQLTGKLFVMAQVMGRISDLSLWTQSRTASTFLDDLREAIAKTVPADRIHEDYLIPGLPNADSYPVDFYIEAPRPLYVFGANNREKARLVTIILSHLQLTQHDFDSLVVLSRLEDIPKPDMVRLMNAANDMVSSVSEAQALDRKLRHRL